MLRRLAVLTAGLAMAASVGLTGAAGASAASPAAITNGSRWTLEDNNSGGCEVETFSTATQTFTSDLGGDSGTWSVPAPNKVKMKWMAGSDAGTTFKGVFASAPAKEYVGAFGGIEAGSTGQLVKGAVSFDGFTC